MVLCSIALLFLIGRSKALAKFILLKPSGEINLHQHLLERIQRMSHIAWQLSTREKESLYAFLEKDEGYLFDVISSCLPIITKRRINKALVEKYYKGWEKLQGVGIISSTDKLLFRVLWSEIRNFPRNLRFKQVRFQKSRWLPRLSPKISTKKALLSTFDKKYVSHQKQAHNGWMKNDVTV